VLNLDGLTTLDADTVKALTEFEGGLHLSDRAKQSFFKNNPFTLETA
jgi:hypothetical protein